MIPKEKYISILNELFQGLEYKTETSELANDFFRYRYILKNRIVDLVFRNKTNFVRTYVLNTENYIPDYKETENCFTLEMLDMLTGTTSKNFIEYFGPNPGDGIYERSIEQILKDFSDVVKANFKVIQGENWPKKNEIDSKYSEKMGYEIKAGWKPDMQLIRYKNELTFLLESGFQITQDDNELPEYDSFRWEPRIIYYNKINNTLLEIEIDYRGQCTNMRFGVGTKKEPLRAYDLKLIQERLNTTPNSTLPKAGRSWWQKLFGS